MEVHFSPGVNCCVGKELPPGPGFRPQTCDSATKSPQPPSSANSQNSQTEDKDQELQDNSSPVPETGTFTPTHSHSLSPSPSPSTPPILQNLKSQQGLGSPSGAWGQRGRDRDSMKDVIVEEGSGARSDGDEDEPVSSGFSGPPRTRDDTDLRRVGFNVSPSPPPVSRMVTILSNHAKFPFEHSSSSFEKISTRYLQRCISLNLISSPFLNKLILLKGTATQKHYFKMSCWWLSLAIA